MALPHRASWAAHFGPPRSLFVGLSDAAGRPRYCCGVDVEPLRSLPGHTVYRIQRFGYTLDRAAISAVLGALTVHAKGDPTAVRLAVETFGAAGDCQVAAADLGFQQSVAPRRYTRTLRLPLDGDREAIVERLPRTARRNLRAAQKTKLEVRTIDEPTLTPRLATLERDAFTRTGGRPEDTDWPALLEYARQHPRLVRVVGVFDPTDDSSESLVGFATARAHGDHVEYAAGAIARRFGAKVSLGYPLVWSLVEWAHALGVSWFDFGGVTATPSGDYDDPLRGISDFKRHFGGTEIEVGDEWVLNVAPVRSAVAEAIGRTARAVRRLA